MAYLTDRPIDPPSLLDGLKRPCDGGLALFVGVVRNENDGHAVTQLTYEAYGPMAEREMAQIDRLVAGKYPGCRIRMRHRTGTLNIGDVAVVVAVAAPHRDEAFAACREGIEQIKARVPIWKREIGPDGAFWVEPCGNVAPCETD